MGSQSFQTFSGFRMRTPTFCFHWCDCFRHRIRNRVARGLTARTKRASFKELFATVSHGAHGGLVRRSVYFVTITNPVVTFCSSRIHADHVCSLTAFSLSATCAAWRLNSAPVPHADRIPTRLLWSSIIWTSAISQLLRPVVHVKTLVLDSHLSTSRVCFRAFIFVGPAWPLLVAGGQ